MGLEMVAFKVVIAGNSIEVVTLGDAKLALQKKEAELRKHCEQCSRQPTSVLVNWK
jgi:hypothetical protein